MKMTVVGSVAMALLVLVSAVRVPAQVPQALPVPGMEPARDLPGAYELPDPKMDYQIDLWAMTTLINLQLKGYVRVG